MIKLFGKNSIAIIAVLATVAALTPNLRADLRVMPLGDSNTVGFHEQPNGSYRYFLEQHFINNGIQYNFVGSKSSGSSSMYDLNHEGWDGYGVVQLTNQIISSNLISAAQPDVILLLIGTNDWGTSPDYNLYRSRYEGLFNAIGNVPIVAATVPRVGAGFLANPDAVLNVNNKRIPLMNQVMRDIAAEPGRENITIVDYYSVMNPAVHLLPDNIHFNTAGHQLLANTFIGGMSVAVPEPSQVFMMLIPVAGLLAMRAKRWWSRRQ